MAVVVQEGRMGDSPVGFRWPRPASFCTGVFRPRATDTDEVVLSEDSSYGARRTGRWSSERPAVDRKRCGRRLGSVAPPSADGMPQQEPLAADDRTLRRVCSAARTATAYDDRRPSVECSPRKRAPVAEELMDRAFGSCQLDTFSLAGATGDRPLSALGMHLFGRLGLVEGLGLERGALSRFLLAVEGGYDEANPYHNRKHAASVLQVMHGLLEHGGLLEAVAPVLCGGGARASQLLRMSCLVAAAVHDYDHPGVTNGFLVNTGHERAVRYEGQHVNEQHHAAAALALLSDPGNNFLEHLPPGEVEQVRELITDLVLSTDMAKHGEITEAACEALGRPDDRASAFRPASRGEALLLLRLAMKCADLGHLALDWDLHVEWVERLEEEFFMQGDMEKAAGLPVSFLMDRHKPGPTRSQVGFYDGVALPLLRLLAQAAARAEPMLAAASANRQRWAELEGARAAGGA